MKIIVEKKLSANDLGITGAHQGGILIPKKDGLLDFFPELETNKDNPRVVITFTDELAQVWRFNYIYYNNRLRGGTRNEYRLTGMTKYLRNTNAKIGDTLVFEKVEGEYSIRIKKDKDQIFDEDGMISLVLDKAWRIINY